MNLVCVEDVVGRQMACHVESFVSALLTEGTFCFVPIRVRKWRKKYRVYHLNQHFTVKNLFSKPGASGDCDETNLKSELKTG